MTSTPILGNEITFSSDPLAFGTEVTPLADDTFILAWENGTDIFARQLDSGGSFTGGNFLSTLSANDPQALSGPRIFQQADGRVVVIYREVFATGDTDIIWHRVNTDFTPDGNRFPIENSGIDEFLIDSTARTGGGGAIIFQVPPLGANSDTHTVLRFIDSVGNQASNQIFVGAHIGETQQNAAVAGLGNGNVVVAYEDFNNTSFARDVRLHIYQPNEADAAGEVILSGENVNAAFPQIAVLKDASFVVVWQESAGIVFRHVSQAGVPDATPLLVPGSLGGFLPRITALNDGGFIIAWTAGSGTESDGTPNEDIFARRISLGGTIGTLLHISEPGDQGLFSMSLATLPDGRAVLAYSSETGDATNLTTLDYRFLYTQPVARDFNRDENSDFLWQNSNGQTVNWQLTRAALTSAGALGNPGPSWHIKATGDFNADGHAGILWQNDTGEVVIWQVDTTSIIGNHSLGNPGANWHAVAAGNFNAAGFGFSDILWQNSNGEAAIWLTDGTKSIGMASLGNLGPSWHVVGTGDFNGDGRSDILWQNSSGETAVWELNGTNVIARANLGNPGPTWHAKATGDFNKDGFSDIVWQNDNGEVAIWELNGTSVIDSRSLGNPGPNWRVVGAGDIFADGTSNTIVFQEAGGQAAVWRVNGAQPVVKQLVGINPGPSWHLQRDSNPYLAGNVDLPWQTDTNEIFLQNDTGEASVWVTNGAALTGIGTLGNPGPDWHARATGDFNGDGNPDLLWQNDTGEGFIWELNGSILVGAASLGDPGASWHVMSVGDFNHDGRSDILWQNSSGEAAIWEMNGTSAIAAANLGNPGPDWHVKGAGDFNGDGFSDILWQNDNGEVVIWGMNGTTVTGAASPGNPGPSWHALGTGDFNGDGRADILWQNDSGEAGIWEMNGATLINAASLANPGPTWHV
jgi:hypothetical protein